VSIYSTAALFFRERLHGSWVPGYLAGRGFTARSLERWQVGYAPPDQDALVRHLRAAGYTDSLILAAGLARRRGRLFDLFRDRAMVPIRSPGGAIIAFIGRAAPGRDPRSPKYLNSPATGSFTKKETLFGLWEARAPLAAGALPVIVEGPLDVMAVAQADDARYAPVSPCGSSLTIRQAEALCRASAVSTTGVMLAFDADKPGRRAAVSAYWTLSALGAETQVAVMAPGTDPAQVLSDQGTPGLAAMLGRCRRPLADLVIDAELARWRPWLRFDEARIAALRSIAPVLAALAPADVARQVGRLARELDLDHGTVTEAVIYALCRAGPPFH
jgi:DNA primase